MDSNDEVLVVEVRFEIEKDAEGYPKSRDAEALLCKPLDALCTVESVPFYLRNVAYGDTISTKVNTDDCLAFDKIVKHSGYSVYRIFLHDRTKKDELIKTLLDLNAIVEQDGNLIAIAVPPDSDADAIISYIIGGKNQGLWGAQDGFIYE